MLRPVGFWFLALPAVLLLTGLVAADDAPAASIVVDPAAAALEKLAAKELRRYVYLRTGQMLPIVASAEGPRIVVGAKDRAVVLAEAAEPAIQAELAALAGQQYRLKTLQRDGQTVVLVAGGDPVGTLYGAYRLAEHLGVRFYPHGDVVPDRQVEFALPELNDVGKPLFELRGIQPFHDFPEGPDWWNADDYKAVLAQLPKLRMNFLGLHTYPECSVGPEPTVWIGPASDLEADGRVKASYPSRHFTTRNTIPPPPDAPSWGYAPTATGRYVWGADALFDRDDWGPDYMIGAETWTKMMPEACNGLFDRTAATLRDAFTFARGLGIKTCVGTETPLTIPKVVQERLRAAGKDPADPAVVRELYEGMFQWIARNYPLDYYWFWTPEGWTWSGTTQQQIDATLADLRAAIEAARRVEAPFTLATCGWVLGPQQDRALFDRELPKDMPMSCINREVGHAPVEPGLARVEGRPKWAIPWLEDDPAMIIPQLWAGRMREDAALARRYGCTGLLGIHWRTRVLGPNVSALAHAAWDQQGWNPDLDPKAESATPAPRPEGVRSGHFAHFPDNPIANTEDDPLYQTVRWNVEGYDLDVPNGMYTVTVKLCEPHYDAAGKRAFGIKLQGKVVEDNIDIFGRVGKDRALDLTFRDVRVTDGRLAIEFVHRIEYPCVAALVVEGPATRKINCGGPAYKDYQADWPAAPPTAPTRGLDAADFYADWARSEFGPEAAEPLAALFNRLDGHLPRPSTWVDGPGGIQPDPRPWADVQKDYAFVEELAALRDRVRGPGNLERFDYWLHQFRYLKALARVNCVWARYNAAIQAVKAEPDEAKRKALARELALPPRRELVAAAAEAHGYLLAAVSTPGGLGNVANWQQHVLPMLLYRPGEELAALLGEPLPADAMPSREYAGPARLFVPTVRTLLRPGEPLRVRVIVLGGTAEKVTLRWRPLGPGSMAEVPLRHVARGVWRVELPSSADRDDLEYHVVATLASGAALHYPPTAPVVNQTVVVAPLPI
ncbi:MAG: hypothetical protein JW809_04260 [Pirellulales bacterium]|nr:hypothetical protein [Pirellulales bacterium]